MTISEYENSSSIIIYPESVNITADGNVYMARVSGEDVLIADKNMGFIGETIPLEDKIVVKASLNHENAS